MPKLPELIPDEPLLKVNEKVQWMVGVLKTYNERSEQADKEVFRRVTSCVEGQSAINKVLNSSSQILKEGLATIKTHSTPFKPYEMRTANNDNGIIQENAFSKELKHNDIEIRGNIMRVAQQRVMFPVLALGSTLLKINPSMEYRCRLKILHKEGTLLVGVALEDSAKQFNYTVPSKFYGVYTNGLMFSPTDTAVHNRIGRLRYD